MRGQSPRMPGDPVKPRGGGHYRSLLRRQQHRRYLHCARPEPGHRLAAPITATPVDVTAGTGIGREQTFHEVFSGGPERAFSTADLRPVG